MTDVEGGRHGIGSVPLDPGDWAGPDLSKRAVAVEPVKLDPALEEFTWISEIDVKALGIRRIRHTDGATQD